MNKKRLLKLADLLEADAANKKGIKFDLRGWGESDNGPPAPDCGTTACAMGLAVVSGAFKRAGLSNYFSEGSYRVNPVMESGRDGFGAAEELFGISGEEARFLFSADRYPENKLMRAAGERFVAKRIRDFVKVNAA